MRTLIILQSRLGSSRLPGKAMLSVAGMPAVVLAARRAGNAGAEVLVATSIEPEDDIVAGAVTAAGIQCFRGSLDDPLSRFVGAVEEAQLDDDDVVVRLTADNMAPDGHFVKDAVGHLLREGLPYLRVDTRTVHGLGVEAFYAGTLRDASTHAMEPFDREHVTPWIRRNVGDDVFEPAMDPRLRGLRCTMDTLDDFVVASRVFDGIEDPVRVPWTVLLDRWSALGADTVRPDCGVRPNAINQGPWVMGSGRIGRPGRDANGASQPGPASTRAILREAVAAGASHVDTSRAFGDSERRIGQANATGLNERAGLITKIEPLDQLPDDAPAEWCRAAVLASAEASLRLLKIDRVAALLLHRFDDWGKGGGAVADTLVELQRAGAAQLIGVSLSRPEELVSALSDPRIKYVQLPFNLLDRRWLTDSVQAAVRERPDVIFTARSVFLRGLLAAPATARWPKTPGVDAVALQRSIGALVSALGRTSPADLALAYVRAHAFITSVVLSADGVAQVREQASLFRSPSLTPVEVAAVHESIPDQPAGLIEPALWSEYEPPPEAPR